MSDKRKVMLVTLRQMELGALGVEETGCEIRCFSSRYMAERWLFLLTKRLC